MKITFISKLDVNGNRYSIEADFTKNIIVLKSCVRKQDDYIEVSKRELNRIEKMFISKGF